MTTKDALGARGLPALATGLMLVAGVVVGVAIATQSLETRRMINAVGGLLWLGGAAVLIRSLWESSRRAVAGLTAVTVIVVLVLAVKPVDLALSIAGFAVGGAIVALVGRDRPAAWALLVPAAWLPIHLTYGVLKGFVLPHGQVRTDPPPTAALVPFSMVVAALVAGLVVDWWLSRRSEAALGA